MEYYERRARSKGYRWIAGVDEAGRGPLAGPVVAACVLWDEGLRGLGIADSKALSATKRGWIFEKIKERGIVFATGAVDNHQIDRMNILKASLEAMARAILALPTPPDFLLVDGDHPVPVIIPQLTIVRGDQRSISIAAASIVAKVTRDRLMEQYHRKFPQYNFLRNKGYPTKEHLEALKRYGRCPLHRLSFRGVKHGR